MNGVLLETDAINGAVGEENHSGRQRGLLQLFFYHHRLPSPCLCKKISDSSAFDQKLPLMAQQPHVPKFGNWDRENIPYTAYFETARKGRGVGGRIINPNDPEERHELTRDEHPHVPPNNDRGPHTVRPTSPTNTWKKNPPTTQQSNQDRKPHSKEGGAFGYVKSPYHELAYHKDGTNAQKSRQDKRDIARYGSEEGYSSSSMHSHQSRPESKYLVGQRYDFAPPKSPQQSASRARGSQHVEAQHHRGTSVPKFGAWDVTNPQAGAGYTMIFDKVKEERQGAANNPPNVRNTPGRYLPEQEIRHSKSTKPKLLCCFLP